jgi:tetratricopeptide (TPR) repeat protein
MPSATLTLSPDDIEEVPTLSEDDVEVPTKQASSAAIGQVTRPQAPAPVAPSSAKPFDLQKTLPAPKGLVKPGNINLNNRPILQNDDGTHSSELSFSQGTDDGEVLVPQIVNGKKISQEEAWKHYQKTGEHMGIFDTPDNADAYAEAVHNRRLSTSLSPQYTLGQEGPLPAPRSTAEGLVTEQQERRGGMPLQIQPASGSLENPHPEQVAAVPRPNATLAQPPVVPPALTQEIQSFSPNAPFTPQEEADRHRQKQTDEAADSSMLANYSKTVEAGRRIGSHTGEQLAAFGTPIEKGYGELTDENRASFEKEHPAAAGISKAAGGFIGGMAADPVTYVFMGSSELAHPMLDRIISTGFRLGLGVHAINAARDLQKNWNDYSPEKRYEVATDAGLSGLLAAGAHQMREFLKGPYEALPSEPNARAESLFRNLVHKAGGTVPENATLEEANAAYRSAIANLHPDVNPEAAEDARNLNDAWTQLKAAGRFSAAGPAPAQANVPQLLPGDVEEAKPALHATNDVEDLRASAERQAPTVGDAVKKATKGVPGAKLEAVRESKDTDRIEDKAERQGVQPSQIGDVLAAKVTAPDQAAADQVLANLHKEMPVESANGAVTGEPGKNAVRQVQAIPGHELEEAIYHFRRAAFLRPTDDTNHLYLAAALDLRGYLEMRGERDQTPPADWRSDLKEAIAQYQAVLSRPLPERINAWRLTEIGSDYFNLRDCENAGQYYRRALEIDPQNQQVISLEVRLNRLVKDGECQVGDNATGKTTQR